MNHGGYPSNDWPSRVQYLRVAVLGAGAAAPVAPANSSVQPGFPKQANCLSTVVAEAPTRSGVGTYVITMDPSFKLAQLLDTSTSVYGTAGMWGAVSAINASTRQLTLAVYSAAGAATDLTATNLCVITVTGIDGTQ